MQEQAPCLYSHLEPYGRSIILFLVYGQKAGGSMKPIQLWWGVRIVFIPCSIKVTSDSDTLVTLIFHFISCSFEAASAFVKKKSKKPF